jgi:hypothetical protein
MGSIFKSVSKVFSSVISVVSSALSWLQPAKPKSNGFNSNFESAQGVLVNKDSNDANIPIVYGTRQVGISRVFVESSGSTNTNLYIAGVLCEGGDAGIESIDSIYIQNEDSAKDIMQWILNKTIKPRKVFELDTFGTQHIQLGDLVKIDYDLPEGVKLVDSNKKFVVISATYGRSSSDVKSQLRLMEV